MPSLLRRPLLVLVVLALVAAVTAAPARARWDGPPKIERPTPKPTRGQRAARIALRAVGIPYRWGGGSPSSGFDCSGLISWAYGRVGVSLPHSSYALYGLGRQVRTSRLRAGDLLFFHGLGHVGLYIGRGRMVHAPRSGRHVEIVGFRGTHYESRLVGARRLVS